LCKEDVLDIAKDLIRIRDTQQVADYVIETLRRMNVDVHELQWNHERPIVVGCIRGEKAYRPILLLSHLDVAPSGANDLWKYPPFEGVKVNNMLYGRGACDAKGCLASAIAAFKAVSSASQLRRTAFLVAIPDGEERFRSINKLLEIKALKGSIAILLEPTCLKICNVQRGMVHLRLTAIGTQSHIAIPWLANNPIQALAEAVASLKELQPTQSIYPTKISEIPSGYSNLLTAFMLGLNTFVVANLSAECKGHTIPEAASADVFATLLAEQTVSDIEGKLRTLLNKQMKECRISVNVVEYTSPFIEPASSEVVRILAKSIRLVMGVEADYEWFPWPTATALLKEMGIASQAVVFGPGDFNMAHRYNECVSLIDLLNAAKILTVLIAEPF
jgi:acetylornithine deacetylase/succinyl-diaminopimelate desuccinylase-like protein